MAEHRDAVTSLPFPAPASSSLRRLKPVTGRPGSQSCVSPGVTASVPTGMERCVRVKPLSPRGHHRRPDRCHLGPSATLAPTQAGERPRLLIPEGSCCSAGRGCVGICQTAAPRGRPTARAHDSPGTSCFLRLSPSVLRRLHCPPRCGCSVLRPLATRGGHPGSAMASGCLWSRGSSTAWPASAPPCTRRSGPWAALVRPLSAEPACGHGTQAHASRVFSPVACGRAAFQGAPRPRGPGRTPVFLGWSPPPGRGQCGLLLRERRREGGAHAARTPS